MEEGRLKAIVESLIFASDSPLTLDRMKEATGENKKDLQRIVIGLIEEYQQSPRSFELAEIAGGYQFRTRPEFAEWIKRLKKGRTGALTQPSLETLAIIAYRQPVVRGDIEKIRGVDSGGVLRTLLERKLIRILGKKDVPGKPLVYGTSQHFLETFGLKDLSGLPTLKDLESLGKEPGGPMLPPESVQSELALPNLDETDGPADAVEHGILSEASKDPGPGGDLIPEEG